jgi:hypothetical protein
MNHQSKWFGYGMGCAAIAFGFVACGRFLATDAFDALQITQVQVLSGSECSVPSSPTALRRTGGILDLDLPDGSLPAYYLPVVVTNNLSSLGTSKAEEMNNIALHHFTVELSAPGVSWDSTTCPSTFNTQEITDLIAPGGSVGEGMSIIMPAHAQCLRGQVPPAHLPVTAKVKAVGRHGGIDIESAEFTYTVDVCMGCLQTDYVDPALVPYEYPADTPMCAAFAGSANPYVGGACLPPGQDKTIFCCAVSQTVGGKAQVIAQCPGLFPTATATSTATSTSTATGP